MPEPKPRSAPRPRNTMRNGRRMESFLDIPPAAAGSALEEVGERRTLASVEDIVNTRALRRQHLAEDFDALVMAPEGGPHRVDVEGLCAKRPGEVASRLLPLAPETL